MGSRSRSSWPRQGSSCSAPSSCSSGSRSGSICSRAAATPTSATPRCARRSPGATTSDDDESGSRPARSLPRRLHSRRPSGLCLGPRHACVAARQEPVRRRTDANGDERFWMLETIREFAREHLAASGEEDALRRLQTDWLIELADRGHARDCRCSRQWDVDLVAPEIDNVRAVLDWAAEHDPERGLALAARSRDSGSFASKPRARHVSSHCSHEPRTPNRSFAPTRCGPSAVRSRSPANPNVPRPATGRASSSSSRAETSVQTANLRYRVAGNMVDRGETAAAWPLLEESLRTFRQLGLPSWRGTGTRIPRGEAPREGDLALAIELRLQSAAIAHEIGWAWWESGQLKAPLERERGNLDAAGGHALRSLELSWTSVTVGAWLLRPPSLPSSPQNAVTPSRPAVFGGDRKRTGVQTRPTMGERPRGARSLVLGVDGPAFAGARTEGRLLSIAEAAGLSLGRLAPVCSGAAPTRPNGTRTSWKADVPSASGPLGTRIRRIGVPSARAFQRRGCGRLAGRCELLGRQLHLEPIEGRARRRRRTGGAARDSSRT